MKKIILFLLIILNLWFAFFLTKDQPLFIQKKNFLTKNHFSQKQLTYQKIPYLWQLISLTIFFGLLFFYILLFLITIQSLTLHIIRQKDLLYLNGFQPEIKKTIIFQIIKMIVLPIFWEFGCSNFLIFLYLFVRQNKADNLLTFWRTIDFSKFYLPSKRTVFFSFIFYFFIIIGVVCGLLNFFYYLSNSWIPTIGEIATLHLKKFLV